MGTPESLISHSQEDTLVLAYPNFHLVMYSIQMLYLHVHDVYVKIVTLLEIITFEASSIGNMEVT